MRQGNIDFEDYLIHIHPDPARRLKTRSSQKILPQVENARLAVRAAIPQSKSRERRPRK